MNNHLREPIEPLVWAEEVQMIEAQRMSFTSSLSTPDLPPKELPTN